MESVPPPPPTTTTTEMEWWDEEGEEEQRSGMNDEVVEMGVSARKENEVVERRYSNPSLGSLIEEVKEKKKTFVPAGNLQAEVGEMERGPSKELAPPHLLRRLPPHLRRSGSSGTQEEDDLVYKSERALSYRFPPQSPFRLELTPPSPPSLSFLPNQSPPNARLPHPQETLRLRPFHPRRPRRTPLPSRRRSETDSRTRSPSGPFPRRGRARGRYDSTSVAAQLAWDGSARGCSAAAVECAGRGGSDGGGELEEVAEFHLPHLPESADLDSSDRLPPNDLPRPAPHPPRLPVPSFLPPSLRSLPLQQQQQQQQQQPPRLPSSVRRPADSTTRRREPRLGDRPSSRSDVEEFCDERGEGV
ncbi:hypothetical protein BDY24DRAFT_384245 [Mrakia frigida]|uniref:uncharacterized protein n=1 Tax=Mrakia frigida TaxID=29902 RepID=UPI003FCBF08F